MDGATYGSLISLFVGALLLFSFQPSLSTAGYGLLIYAGVGLAIDEFTDWHKVCAGFGAFLVLAKYFDSGGSDGGVEIDTSD